MNDDQKRINATARKQKERVGNKILKEEMEASGYRPVIVYMHPEHIKAIIKIDVGLGSGSIKESAGKISEYVFSALKMFIKSNDGIDKDNMPDYSFHEIAQLNAKIRFDDWVKESEVVK